jgi:hypothetical protein
MNVTEPAGTLPTSWNAGLIETGWAAGGLQE